MSEHDEFLKPSKHIDSMDSRIIEKAKALAGREKDILSIVEIFFVYVRNNVSYYNSSEVSVSTATETLVSGSGDSVGKACLLTALCRVMEIPAGVSFQLIKDMKLADTHEEKRSLRWHAITNINLNGTWLKMDPSYDWWFAHGRHSLLPGFIDNNGVVIPQKDIEGKDNFTVIKESPIFEDIPAEWENTLINNKNELF